MIFRQCLSSQGGCRDLSDISAGRVDMLSGWHGAAGGHLSVFGIEALKATPAAGSQGKKRPRDAPSAQQGSSGASSSKRLRAVVAAAAAADRSEAAIEANPPEGASGGEQQMLGLGQAADSGEAARGGPRAAKSFSFPVLDKGEGSAPTSIKTPASRPRSDGAKRRYFSCKGAPYPTDAQND